MANTAHFITVTTSNPTIVVRDDRGASVIELEMPTGTTENDRADEELRTAGWSRSTDWTKAADGWVAPVVPA